MSKRTTCHHHSRRGAAVVEFAITLPILVMLVLGTIEACSMIFLQQSLEIAAYEGARFSLVPGADSAKVSAGSSAILTTRRVNGFTITTTPSNFPTMPYGTPIRVQVTAPCNANSLIAPMFYGGKVLIADVTMMKEN